VVGLGMERHEAPPSSLRRIVPWAPTAVTVSAVTGSTANRSLVEPPLTAHQRLPPSVVRAVRPVAPATTARRAVPNEAANSERSPTRFFTSHDAPLSRLQSTAPRAPNAHTVVLPDRARA